MAPHAAPARVKLYQPSIAATLVRYDIGTPLRQAHFFAQVAHESEHFRYAEEIATGAAYEDRADLGNTQAGDGVKFEGRGLMQLTGRQNYTDYDRAIGVDLTVNKNWESVSNPQRAVDVAGWFWRTRNLNAAADRDDVLKVTKIINGGTNGLEDRRNALCRTKFLFKIR